MIYVFAFLGGLLLNLMPCTAGLIFIKLKNLNWYAAQGHMLGTLCVFAGFGALASTGARWGAVWDNQYCTVAFIFLTLYCGLAYLDVWSFPTIPWQGSSGAFSGILCALFATPCSGPLLGPVFAWSLTRTPIEAFLVVFTVGVGMASPFLLIKLVSRERLANLKAGKWTLWVERASGVALVVLAAWMNRGLNPVAIVFLVLGVWAVALVCLCYIQSSWLFGSAICYTTCVAVFCPLANVNTSPVALPPRALVVFSTPSCLNCQVNKRVIYSNNVTTMCEKLNVQVIEIDVRTPHGEKMLRAIGCNSVPVTAIYKDGEPVWVRTDLITRHDILIGLTNVWYDCIAKEQKCTTNPCPNQPSASCLPQPSPLSCSVPSSCSTSDSKLDPSVTLPTQPLTHSTLPSQGPAFQQSNDSPALDNSLSVRTPHTASEQPTNTELTAVSCVASTSTACWCVCHGNCRCRLYCKVSRPRPLQVVNLCVFNAI